MPKKNKLESILHGKCPRCHQGNMFTHHHLNYLHFNSMHSTCSKCGLRFEIEPGFFYGGAMYFSYVFSVAIFLITSFFVFHFLDNPPTLTYVAFVSFFVAIVFPLNYRYSRILFLYLFGGVKYDPKYGN
jgi:uncharacterized protein (DUF983 family)